MFESILAPGTIAERFAETSIDSRPVSLGEAPLPARLRPHASLGVLDITEWFGTTSGGIRTYLLEKAAYIEQRQSLRHVIVVPGQRDSITDADGVRMYRLQGPPIPRQKPYRFMLATKSVSRIVRHEAPDIIEIGSPFIVPWIVRRATRNTGVPLVCFYHSNLPRMFAPRSGRNGRLRQAVYRASWRYMKKLDGLFPLTIVSSSYAANDLEREGITRIAKVPLGVDLDCFSTTRRSRAQQTRKAHRLPDGPLAGFVGRFAREKELNVLLDAWSEVERRTGARLALVGAGPLEQMLRSHRYGGRVFFIPFQSERDALADLLAAFDIYVAPGRIETFGLSSLEALASGTPVLAADEGGVAEQVANSRAGRTFVSGNSESLAEEAIAMFAGDLGSAGTRGRSYAEREHGWETVFDTLMIVYREVIRVECGR